MKFEMPRIGTIVIAIYAALVVALALSMQGGVFGWVAETTGTNAINFGIMGGLVANIAYLARRRYTVVDLVIGTSVFMIYVALSWAYIISQGANPLTGAVYTAVYLLPIAWKIQIKHYEARTIAGKVLTLVTVERIVAFVMIVGGVDLLVNGVRFSWVVLTGYTAITGNMIAVTLIGGAVVVSYFRLQNEALIIFSMPVLVYAIFVTIRLLNLQTSYPPIPLWIGFVLLVAYCSAMGESRNERSIDIVTSNNPRTG